MDSKIAKAYKDARAALDQAYIDRDKAVEGYRADCRAKIEIADAEVARLYEAHNAAKMAYAREVSNDDNR